MKKLLFILFLGSLFYGVNAQSWSLSGNANTNPPTNYIGTSDAQPLIFKTNNAEHLRILSDGRVGIGTEAPLGKLHIKDGSLIISKTIIDAPEPIDNIFTYKLNGKGETPIVTWTLDNLIGNEYGLHFSSTPGPTSTPLHSYLFMGLNGFIGMGNKNPLAKLDVTGGIRATAAAITGPVTARKLSVDTIMITGHTTSYGNTTLYGNVGIGTNVPQTTLDVNGSFRAKNANITEELNVEKLIVNGRSTFQIIAVSGKSYLMGNVGIGTNSPQAKLDVDGDMKAKSADISGALTAQSANIARTLTANALNAQSADISGTLTANALNSQNANIAGTLTANALNSQSANITGALTANTLNVPNVTGNVNFTGNVGIGVNPTTKLDVKGTIRAEEVKVCLNQGCDFVFEEDYKLMGLDELEKFIKTNKHLPEVAPAAIMEAEGINISEMSAKLLQKIEELTLYIIDLQKQIEELKSNNYGKGDE